MQQPTRNDRLKMLAQMFVIWGISVFLLQKFFPPPVPPGSAEFTTRLERALAAETAGRQAVPLSWPLEWKQEYQKTHSGAAAPKGPELSRADRIKRLEEAVHEYDEYARISGKSLESWRAKYQAINIYDYLGEFESRSATTHWYDLAEPRLKEMERQLHGVSGVVTLEVQGKLYPREANLGSLAAWRLDRIRAARDDRNHHKITWLALNWVVVLMGKDPQYSYFLALLLIVVVLKGATFPFLIKQYQYQREMMRIQPLVKQLQEEMKGRPPQEMQTRMSQLYKEHNVNLFGGCLPMLVLMVVLFPVFWMVRDYEYQFTYASFLWIGSELSRQTWWLADNLAQFDVPLFVTYMLSTVVYSLLQPKPADPQQAQQQRMMIFMMPAVFAVMMWQGQWSSAFMLYWLILNLVSMYQSWLLNKRFGLGGAMSAAAPAVPVVGGAPSAEVTSVPLVPMKGVRTSGKKPRRSQVDPLNAARQRSSRK